MKAGVRASSRLNQLAANALRLPIAAAQLTLTTMSFAVVGSVDRRLTFRLHGGCHAGRCRALPTDQDGEPCHE